MKEQVCLPVVMAIGNVTKGSTLYISEGKKASNQQRAEKDIQIRGTVKVKRSYEKWFRMSDYQRKFGTQQ